MRSHSDRRGSSRRNFARSLALGALALAVGSLGTAGAAAAKDLHVLNWQGYGTDEAWATKLFEERTGCKVVHDYFNSEEEMLTKLRTNPGTYDVVLINSSYTQGAAKEGLIQPIDTSKLANWKDLNPKLRDSPYLNTDGKTYGLSWVWGVTSFAYNTDDIKTQPDTIEALWDPA
jgi:spermidine/putrescine transport system substrate-binding protein